MELKSRSRRNKIGNIKKKKNLYYQEFNENQCDYIIANNNELDYREVMEMDKNNDYFN